MIREQIPAALVGERIDRIVALLTGASRSDAAALVASGGVTVDGQPALSGKVRVVLGQIVEVDPAQLPERAPPVGDASIVVPVLYADDDVIVVDKPAGLVVHPGHGHPDGTLVNAMLAVFPDIAGVGDPMRPGVVHRLDVGTSGLMVLARSARAYGVLTSALAARTVSRTYVTLVWGELAATSGLIDAPLGRDPRDPLRMAVVVGGKQARTRYTTTTTFTEPASCSLLECRLETGRTHQIRVHLAAAGHPVIGDGTYGGVRTGITLARPFLHASSLAFTHPATGLQHSFDSALPDDLSGLLATLS